MSDGKEAGVTFVPLLIEILGGLSDLLFPVLKKLLRFRLIGWSNSQHVPFLTSFTDYLSPCRGEMPLMGYLGAYSLFRG